MDLQAEYERRSPTPIPEEIEVEEGYISEIEVEAGDVSVPLPPPAALAEDFQRFQGRKPKAAPTYCHTYAPPPPTEPPSSFAVPPAPAMAPAKIEINEFEYPHKVVDGIVVELAQRNPASSTTGVISRICPGGHSKMQIPFRLADGLPSRSGITGRKPASSAERATASRFGRTSIRTDALGTGRSGPNHGLKVTKRRSQAPRLKRRSTGCPTRLPVRGTTI